MERKKGQHKNPVSTVWKCSLEHDKYRRADVVNSGHFEVLLRRPGLELDNGVLSVFSLYVFRIFFNKPVQLLLLKN